MILIYSLIIGLAAYRLWRITGLDKITERPREWLYDKADREARVHDDDSWHPWQFAADLIGCPWCWGWWICGALSGLVTWHAGAGWLEFALLWCASSTICGWLKMEIDG